MNIDLQAREIQPLRQTYTHVARVAGGSKPASRYQEASYGGQATTNFHYRPTWDPAHEIFDKTRTQVVLADWESLKDPRQFYYASWAMARARQQEGIEANFQFVESRAMADKMPDALRHQVLQALMPLRHVAWGANMNNASICAYGYGMVFTAPAMFHAMDNLGVAQLLTRLGLLLDEPGVLDEGKAAWLQAPAWQPLRQLVEDLLVLQDPFELYVAQNLVLDGLLYPLVYGSFVDEHVALQGGTAVAMLTAFMPEWQAESARWIDAVVETAAAESPANRELITRWVKAWTERSQAALAPVAQLAFGNAHAALAEAAQEDAHALLADRCRKAGVWA